MIKMVNKIPSLKKLNNKFTVNVMEKAPFFEFKLTGKWKDDRVRELQKETRLEPVLIKA